MLNNKKIVLGVCGGIAVYKAVELLRLLVKAGADVTVVMTRNAQEFVTPLTFQSLSGNPVHSELFNLYQEKTIGHISLADAADLFIVAPATANVIGKVNAGIADDLLTTAIMATTAPVLFAPAMNVNMYQNPVYQRNEAALAQLGYHFVAPAEGELACGYSGKGKLAAVEDIVAAARAALSPQDLAGKTVLVSAGPTRENIDPVRYVSNYSSGKMGYAAAAAARRRGARVVLVSGPVALRAPWDVELVPVVSAAQMYDAVMQALPQADVVIKAAAVADYRPAQAAEQKIKKNSDQMSLELERNADILAAVGQNKGERVVVGFAAESEKLLEHAADKLRRKNLDMIVANDITASGAGFDVDTNIVNFIYADGRVEKLAQMSKDAVADNLLERVVRLIGQQV